MQSIKNKGIRWCFLCCALATSAAIANTDASTESATNQQPNSTLHTTASVPNNAAIIDEIIYLVGTRAVLLSERRNMAFFLRAQMALGVLPQAELTAKSIEDALLDFIVQRTWCDRFGIVVSDDSVFKTLEKRAAEQGQTLAQMRDDMNRLAPGGYEIFYELNRQQMRFAQLHYAIARQEIRINTTEIDEQYNSLPEWRTSATYVLLFAKHDTQENRALLTAAVQNNDQATLTQWQNQKRVRFIEYANESLGKIPAVIVDNMPTEVGKSATFTTESGYNIVHLQARTLDVPTLREYQLQQLIADDSHILTQVKQQFGTDFQSAFAAQPKVVGLVDVKPRWYTLNSLPPELAQAIAQTPVGAMTRPISIGKKWYLVHVIANKNPSEETVKAAIKQRLFTSRFDLAVSRWLNETKQKTYIQAVR